MVVLLAVFRDHLSPDVDAQRIGDVRDTDTEIGGPVAKDRNAKLRHAHRHRRIGVDDTRYRLHAGEDLVRVPLEPVDVGAEQVELDVREPLPLAGEHVDALHARANVGIIGEQPPRVGHDVELRERALLEIEHAHVDRADRHVALARAHSPLRVPDRGDEARHAAQPLHPPLDLREQRGALIERIAARRLDDDLELALIVGGEKVLADELEEKRRRREDAERDENHDPAVA